MNFHLFTDVDFWLDVALHATLEGIGGLITIFALGYCKHPAHRAAWMVSFGIFSSIITVGIVG